MWTIVYDLGVVVVFDLDDTLYAEADYVESAYREIARRYGLRLLPAMMGAPSPREAFDSTGIPVGELLGIYRAHMPSIRLPWESLYVLASLKNSGHTLGLITDGRSVTQRHKIEALGLDRFIDADMIFVSEETGEEKISGSSVRRVMELRPGERYMYVGDNPVKDFTAPARYGWQTVMLLSRGRNINPQTAPTSAHPVRSLLDLLSIVGMYSSGSD